MRHVTAFLLLLVLFACVSTRDVQAQIERIEVGPRIGFDIFGDLEEFFIGVEARFTVGSLPVIPCPTFDYYFTEDNVTVTQLGLNALYEFGIDNQAFTPYVGGGLGITRVSVDVNLGAFGRFGASDTDVGLNLIGGATFGTGNTRPFAFSQITIGDLDLFLIGGGLLFTIGGG